MQSEDEEIKGLECFFLSLKTSLKLENTPEYN